MKLLSLLFYHKMKHEKRALSKWHTFHTLFNETVRYAYMLTHPPVIKNVTFTSCFFNISIIFCVS